MPQGDRTPAEKAAFVHMLGNVNSLYLGCSVLILLDLSYLSRFWTQFEAWLSMQTPSPSGLSPSKEDAQRFKIVTVLNGNSIAERILKDMWVSATPDEAYEVLSKEDVTVTNASDKSRQLPKLKALDAEVKRVMA